MSSGVTATAAESRGGGRSPAWSRIAGALLVAVPFLPVRWLFGPLQGAEALVPPSEWVLGLAIFGATSWLLLVVAGDRLEPAARWPGALRRCGDARWLAAALVPLAALLVAASWLAFDRSPLLIDSVVQLFQAKIFVSGALKAPPPPEGGFFLTQHMLVDNGGWYSQYAPGHPALLAVGAAFDAAWAVPVLLSLATALLLFGVSTRIWGRTAGRLTLLLVLFSPFFWFMGASCMNHVPALFLVSAFLYLFVRWEASPTAGRAAAAGAVLGAAALVRPLTAVAVAVPFAAFAVADGAGSDRRDRSVRSLAPLAAAVGGFAVVASLYLAYNAVVTGDPFLPGYLKLWGEGHGLGFHPTPWGGEHTPLAGLRNELIDLSLLNLYLFEWPIPALLPVGAAFILGWTGERWDRRLLLAFLAVPAAYFFYWHRDAFLGPRFLYAGLAFLLPLTARSLLAATRQFRDVTFRPGDLFRPVRVDRWATVFLGLCVAYGILYGTPQRFRVYATGMSSMKVDLRSQARDAGIDEGLIFVKVSWGNRILTRLRALGVPAPDAEKVYREVGHCRLHRLVETATRERWSGARMATELSRATADDVELVETARLNGDPTLRIRSGGGPLPDACREEIRYDLQGYTLYSPYLVVNVPDLTGPFVVARDLRVRNAELMAHYPKRPAYLFDGERFTPIGARTVSGAEEEEDR